MRVRLNSFSVPVSIIELTQSRWELSLRGTSTERRDCTTTRFFFFFRSDLKFSLVLHDDGNDACKKLKRIPFYGVRSNDVTSARSPSGQEQRTNATPHHPVPASRSVGSRTRDETVSSIIYYFETQETVARRANEYYICKYVCGCATEEEEEEEVCA